MATILIVSVVPTLQASPYGMIITALDQETGLEMTGVKFWYGGTMVWNPEKQIKELVGASGPFITPAWIGALNPCEEVLIAFEANPQDYPELSGRIKCDLNTFPVSVTSGVMGGALVDRNPPTQDYWPVKVWWIHNSEDADADVKAEYGRAGPNIDKLRFEVIKSPDARLIAMQTCVVDVWSTLDAFCNTEALIFGSPCQMRPEDIETLDEECFTVTDAPAFHVKFMGINIRPDQSYRSDPIHGRRVAAVLSDVNFRHALVHCYDQEEIVAEIKGYTATPTRSLVPPAQGGWLNPNVPTHPYNLGIPYLDTNEGGVGGVDCSYVNRYPNDHSASGILRYGGYIHVFGDWVTPYDLDGDGVPGTMCDTDGDDIPDAPGYMSKCRYHNYITDPDDVISPLHLLTPVAQSEHADRFSIDCNAIDIPLIPDIIGYDTLIQSVYEDADFDLYMAGLALGRFPDHLYPMGHSSEDSQPNPGKFNAPGIHDPELDEKLETLKFSLDHAEKLEACFEIQRELYDENCPLSAFAYIPMYSRVYFNAFKTGLQGIVNSPGYGSDNIWTFLNIRWEPGHPYERTEDGKSTVIWILCDEPERLHPLGAYCADTWEIMARTMDCLIEVNPYSHENKPWMAESWEAVETPGGPGAMDVTFHLRRDVFWQDGRPYTAEDAKFNWLFLRNNQIPRYQTMWEHIIDVEVVNNYEVRVCLDVTSQFLIYDLACTAAMLPPPVWKPFDGKPLEVILAYDPSHNTTKPTNAGPWFGWRDPATGQPLGAVTQLYGTGPFIFDFYDPVGMYADMHAWRCYWKMTDEIQAQLVDMFHRVGDVNYDGIIDDADRDRVSALYGCMIGDPCYDPDVDINSDGIIDLPDVTLVNAHWGEVREYPYYSCPKIQATVDIDPDSLNLKTTVDKWITAYIELPEPYNVADIDLETIRLNTTVPAMTDPKYGFVTDPEEYITDNDEDGILERMVKFDRAEVISFIRSVVEINGWRFMNVTLTVRGEAAGILFEGRDIVKVIVGDVNGDGVVDIIDLSMVAISFGCVEGEPEYDWDADINEDCIVDIFDISIVGMNYGESL